MIRHLILTLLLLPLLCTSGRAQNSPAVEVDNNPEDDQIRLIARPHGDSITLRWAPVSFAAWSQLRTYGVAIERRKIGTDKEFSVVPGERRMAYSLDDIRSFADTNNVHVIAVAEAMYGAATPGTNEGPLGRAKDIHEEQSQRLFLAQVNADLSPQAAEVLGWRFVDHSVESGFTYDYRLRLLDSTNTHTAVLRQRSDGKFYDGPVLDVRAETGDLELNLLWPQAVNGPSFIAYRLEVSDDGQGWEQASELPFIPEVSEPNFHHKIKLPANGKERHYRLRGINSFGEVCPPSEAVVAAGIDLTAPPAPFSVNGTDLKDGRNRIHWTVPKEMPSDLAGYRVLRGLQLQGKLVAITEDLLPPGTTTWIDPSAIPNRNNYYAIEAVDQSGNASRSPVNFVQRFDDTPPAKPVGLTGRIDSLGRVFLLWEPGTEPDLLGYRVYRSHARKREFLQVTSEVQHRNFFFDSTSLLVLNETILYQIVAVDNHYNPSEYSEILELKRPDKIPPAAPSISGYSARGTSVVLRIRPSESTDVVRQTIWRATNEEAPRPVAALGAQDTLFTDTTTAVRTAYTYSVRAEDEVGLFGDSRPLRIRSGLPATAAGPLNVARTQVQGTDEEKLQWAIPAGTEISGFQLYAGPQANALRPLRRLAPGQTEWTIPRPEQYYALRIIYANGSRSPISQVLPPEKR